MKNNSIEQLTKCRLETIFGDGTYFGCLTFSKIILAMVATSIMMLILFSIWKLFKGQKE